MKNRLERMRVAQETLEVLGRGEYEVEGKKVSIRQALEAAKGGSVFFSPEEVVEWEGDCGGGRMEFFVENLPTLEVAHRIYQDGVRKIFVLNFASARHPGGGFLAGAMAQEESLAYASGLYECLVLFKKEYYDYHKRFTAPFYSDGMIYSPQVPVFRDGEGRFLASPYYVSFLTSPAVNCHYLGEGDRAKVEGVMRRRIDRVLAVACKFGYRHLVLGAWGCGAFGNSAEEVSLWFGEALRGRFWGCFEEVYFAVLDFSEEKRNYLAFYRRFMERGA
ncbi:MAG: TIGR02452 family protein [Planctomycetota bacterium]|nr:MAG: TIGR02452 family protein [Planctomycetota bacterium]